MSETQKRKRTGITVALVTAGLVLAGGGATWGYFAYQDAQATAEAEALGERVLEARVDAETAITAHLAVVTDVEGMRDTLQPSVEIVEARAELFAEEPLEAFTSIFHTLGEEIEQPQDTNLAAPSPFDNPEFFDEFVEAYRGADENGRAELTANADAAVDQLGRQSKELAQADSALAGTVAEAQQAGIALANTLSDQADHHASAHPEADAEITAALHNAVSAEGVEAPADDNLADHIAGLQDRLIQYVEAVDRVKESHTAAVAAREEAERKAAEEAAAAEAAARQQASQQASPPQGGGDNGNYGMMCSRVVPNFNGMMSLMLVPC